MYAVVRIGGKQYPVEAGQVIAVEKLPHEAGDKVTFDEVLLIRKDGDTVVGQPVIAGASVKATVVEQFKGRKIIVFKYKPKNRYRRKQGHRQQYTRLRIDEIIAAKKSRAKAKPAQEAEPAAEAAE